MSSIPSELRPAQPTPSDSLSLRTGAPIPDNRNSLTVGPHGPMVMHDIHYFNKIQAFDRERIPERVVHALGIGAHGYFEVTRDISHLTKAKIFNSVGKKTDVFVRFSGVSGERGAADTERDPRGFAIKMYSDDGIWDLVCNNIPVFFIRDPMLFPDLIHSVKRDPKTDMKLASSPWDFFAGAPESIHAVTMLFGDRGLPASFRHMNGYGNHTFVMVNAAGERTFVKFHIKAVGGVKTMTSDAAEAIRGADTDYLRRDLVDFLMAGGEAEYTMFLQVIPEKDAASLPYDILDVTKVVPHADYPLIPVGRYVLNRMVENFFAETEQSAFCPGNLVPGIEPTFDRTFVGRVMSYTDTQRYRLGTNFQQLPINRPRGCPFFSHMRDGFMAYPSDGAATNYHTTDPHSGGAQVGVSERAKESAPLVEGKIGRFDMKPADPDADFVQPRKLYRDVMTEGERCRLTANIAAHLSDTRPDIQKRMLEIFYKVDEDYGRRVETLLKAIAEKKVVLVAAKEPSPAFPMLTEFHFKKGHSVVDVAGGAYLTPAAELQGIVPAPRAEFDAGKELPIGAIAAPMSLAGTLKEAGQAVLSGVKKLAGVEGEGTEAVAGEIPLGKYGEARKADAGSGTPPPISAGTAAGQKVPANGGAGAPLQAGHA